jgi:purine-binding chemotaxis protein CheW
MIGTKGTQRIAAGTERYLVFQIAGQDFCVPLTSVREVVALPQTTRVPYTPSHFLGIMNLRGQIVSVFDLRLKLGQKAEQHAETAVIICDFEDLVFGVVVDFVKSVLAIESSKIQEPPMVESKVSTEYLNGVVERDDRLILLLSLGKALSLEDIAAMRRSQSAA